jgi:hypothetical protein
MLEKVNMATGLWDNITEKLVAHVGVVGANA